VNDTAHDRSSRLSAFRLLLSEEGVHVLPGSDGQLLGILRAANCGLDEALEVAKTFVEYQKHCHEGENGIIL
jgi:hypothetical protein